MTNLQIKKELEALRIKMTERKEELKEFNSKNIKPVLKRTYRYKRQTTINSYDLAL